MAWLLTALLIGVASAFGFAPFGLWPLLLLGFGILLLVLERAQSRRMAFGIGWCFGLGQFVLGLDWIATAFTYQAAMPHWLGWVAVVLLSFYLAIYPGLATLAAWWATRRLGAGAVTLSLLFGACWTATEYLRGTMFTGFPWNPVAAALIDLPIAKASRLIGTYGLSGLAIATVGFIAILATRPAEALRRTELVKPRVIPALIGLVLLSALYAGPVLIRLASAPTPPPMPKGNPVEIIQPNIAQDERVAGDMAQKHLVREQALSGGAGTAPRLVLWPESGIEDNIAEDPQVAARVTDFLGPKDILLSGGEQPIRDAKGELIAARNSVFVLASQGRILGRYDKAHLVPYGEYLPMRPLLSAIGLSRLVPGDLDFWPGPGARTLDVPGFGPVGMQICYEMVFSGKVVDESHRPLFLFNPSNDAWFGASGPPQHLAQARLRAIEEGMPVARATQNGISALIDTDGRVLKSLGSGVMGMTALPMPAPLPPTLFSRLGNVAAFLTFLALAGLAIAARRYKESFI